MKRFFVLSVLLLLSIIPVWAQEAAIIPLEEAIEIPRVMPLIDGVELTVQDDQPALLISGTMPDGCERPTLITKDRQGEVLFVDVFHEPVPPSAQACPKMLLLIEAVVPVEELLTLDENDTLPRYLAVNDQYFAINMAQIEPTGDGPAVPPMMLTSLVHTPVRLESVDIWVDDEAVWVMIEGYFTAGCADPALSRVMRTSAEAHEYVVDVFQALVDPMACPATYVAVEFDLAVKTPADPTDEASFTVLDVRPDEGKLLTYSPDGQSSTPDNQGDSSMRVLHTIESVDARLMESFPVQIMLDVKGYQPDGCDVPVQVEQSGEGNAVKVEIFRELPPDAICTMIIKEYQSNIKLEGGFETGTYTIDINGTVITVKI